MWPRRPLASAALGSVFACLTAQAASHAAVCSGSAAAPGLAATLLREASPPTEIYTRHAVLAVPSAPVDAGGAVAAWAYAGLPRAPNGAPFLTSFTKVVVVGYGQGGPRGLSVGSDVCTGDLVDEEAVSWFRQEVTKQASAAFAPVFDCSTSPSMCPTSTSQTLEAQIPFLEELFSGGALDTSRTLAGRVLPVMMQDQTAELGVQVGTTLELMVAEGGFWSSERVLFVFGGGGDLSSGLVRSTALERDTETVKEITTEGCAGAASYFAAAPAGEEAVPVGFGALLAASRLAEVLGLDTTRSTVSSSGAFRPDADMYDGAVQGYASIMFWHDYRPLGERQASNSTVLLKQRHAVKPSHTAKLTLSAERSPRGPRLL